MLLLTLIHLLFPSDEYGKRIVMVTAISKTEEALIVGTTGILRVKALTCLPKYIDSACVPEEKVVEDYRDYIP